MIKKYLTFDNLIALFLIFQPLLEIYYLYHGNGVEGMFSFSIATIIRFIIYALIFLYFMYKHKDKNMFIFGIIFIIYFIIHSLLLYKIDLKYLGSYSLISEAFYLIRLFLPLLSIYVFYKSSYSSKSIYKGLFISSLIFSLIMIVSNIFYFALPSYYSPVYKIETNIFGWFNSSDLNYYQMATKGLFNASNSISSAYILILPILLISLFKKTDYKKTIIIFITIISLLMLGSRVSAYGSVLIILAILVIYVICSIFKDKKIQFKNITIGIIILISSTLLFLISPIRHRSFKVEENLTEDVNFETLDNKIEKYKEMYEEGLTKEEKEEIITYLYEHNSNYLINGDYLKAYKPEYDLEFWLNYYSLDESIRGDNRNIQSSIINRIYEKDLDFKKILFGFSYSATFNNGIFIEKDISSHFLYLGLIGVLLFIMPYFIICLYGIYKSLRNIKHLDFEITGLLFSICLILMVSYLAGNTLDNFVVTIPLGILSGYMLKRIKEVYND